MKEKKILNHEIEVNIVKDHILSFKREDQ